MLKLLGGQFGNETSSDVAEDGHEWNVDQYEGEYLHSEVRFISDVEDVNVVLHCSNEGKKDGTHCVNNVEDLLLVRLEYCK